MPTITPIPTTPVPGTIQYPFIQEGTAAQYSASLKGCNWLGIGGYVYDTSRAPINNLYIQLTGNLPGRKFDELQVTGTVPEYGPGGFEFTLGDRPILSINSLWLQLLDASRAAISDKIMFNTYEGCDRNMIQINFIQRPS
jgi:hypothetical protein